MRLGRKKKSLDFLNIATFFVSNINKTETL